MSERREQLSTEDLANRVPADQEVNEGRDRSDATDASAAMRKRDEPGEAKTAETGEESLAASSHSGTVTTKSRPRH